MLVDYFKVPQQHLLIEAGVYHEKFQNNRSPCQDCNTGPPKYAVVLITSARYSMCVTLRNSCRSSRK